MKNIKIYDVFDVKYAQKINNNFEVSYFFNFLDAVKLKF